MLTKEDVIDLMIKTPYQIGHELGFTKLTWLNNLWIREFVTGKEDYTLQAHRGSYKTTCVSLALAIIITLNPNKRILFLRKTDTDTKEIVNQVYKILTSNQWRIYTSIIYTNPIKLTTSNYSEINTSYNLDTKGTNQLVAQGIGGSLTGKHFDLIFTDDIVNLQDRISQAERDRTKIIYQELQNIKNRGGRLVNTGTPWHIQDCFSLMPNIHRFDCYQTKLMTDEEIAIVKKSMIPSLFSANYELKHIADEKALFRDPKYIATDIELIRDGIAHIDASYGGEDYTAFTCAKKASDGKIYVLGKMWDSHVDNHLMEIMKIKERFMLGKTYCEDNADKGYLKKTLKEFGDNVASYHEHMNKFVKISTNLYRDWENIVFLDETDEAYVQQIINYNEEAEHDDAPDSLACICRKLHKVSNEDYISPFM